MSLLLMDRLLQCSRSESESAEDSLSSTSGMEREAEPKVTTGQVVTKRRQRNKDAARKTRKKQTERADELHEELQMLERSNFAIHKEIAALKKDLEFYQKVLEQHKPHCLLEGRGLSLCCSGPPPAAHPSSSSPPQHSDASSSSSAPSTPTLGLSLTTAPATFSSFPSSPAADPPASPHPHSCFPAALPTVFKSERAMHLSREARLLVQSSSFQSLALARLDATISTFSAPQAPVQMENATTGAQSWNLPLFPDAACSELLLPPASGASTLCPDQRESFNWSAPLINPSSTLDAFEEDFRLPETFHRTTATVSDCSLSELLEFNDWILSSPFEKEEHLLAAKQGVAVNTC